MTTESEALAKRVSESVTQTMIQVLAELAMICDQVTRIAGTSRFLYQFGDGRFDRDTLGEEAARIGGDVFERIFVAVGDTVADLISEEADPAYGQIFQRLFNEAAPEVKTVLAELLVVT